MAKQTLNNNVTFGEQRGKINENFTELYSEKQAKAPSDGKTYGLKDGGLVELPNSAGAVDSVNGQTGAVALTTDNIPQTTTKQYVSDTEKINWNAAAVGSNLGLLKTTDTPPITGTFRGDVNSAGTYTNFKTAALASIVFTSAELLDNFGYIYVVNNVATKSLIAKKGGNANTTLVLDTFVKGVTTVNISNLSTIRTAGYLLKDNTIVTGTNNYSIKDYDVLSYDYLDFTGVRAKSSVNGSVFILGINDEDVIEVLANANAKTSTPNITETLRFNIKNYKKISFCYSNTVVPTINLVNGDVPIVDSVRKEIDAKVSNKDSVMLSGSESTGLSVNKIFKVLGDFKNTGISTNLATTLVSGWIQSANNNIQSGSELTSQKDIAVTGGQTFVYYSSLAWSSLRSNPVSVLGITSDGLLIPLLKSGEGVVSNTEKPYEIFIPTNIVAVSVTFNTSATIKQFGLKASTLPLNVKDYIDGKTNVVPSLQSRLDKLDLFTSITPTDGILKMDLATSGNFKTTISTTSPLSIMPIPLNTQKDQIGTLYLKLSSLPSLIELPQNARWKSSVLPTFVSGNSYFLMFQSFDYGVNWVASVIGTWETKTLLGFDNFVKADSITTVGTTLEGGLSWEGATGTTWGIKNNKPYQVSTVNATFVAVTPPTPYILITAIFFSKSNNNGISFRVKDSANFNAFYLDGVGNNVYKRTYINGSPTAIGTYAISASSIYILQVKLDSNGKITYYCNGKEVHNITEPLNQNEARAGLFYSFGNTTQTDCNYFSIASL